MPKLISEFKQKYPKLELVLHEGTVDEVKEWLHTRMIDVGILLYPTEEIEYIPLKKTKCPSFSGTITRFATVRPLR